MNGDDSKLWSRLAVALGLAIGTAALAVSLVEKPTWAVRAAAIGWVLLVVLLVLVWHWGAAHGSND